MSRSLVGSSRSSTLGSVSSSRSSWKRRRSPPDRSPRRAVSRSPVKPKRSSSADAVTSPVVVRATRRIDSTLSSTRACGSRSSSAWVRCCRATVRPSFTRPADGRQRAVEQRQHRRLPGAVDPDDAHPVARPEPPGRVRQQHAVTAHQVDVLDVDDVLAEPLGGEALELEPVARRRLVVDQGRGRVDPELRLRGARGRPTPQPGQLLAHQVAPAYLRGGRLPLPLGLGEHERGVAALVAVDHAVVDLPGLLAHRVEEPPVVGDHDQRRRQRDQVLGQPGHGLHVEVVGGLVEDDQVVLVQQQLGERAAPPLAAGQPDHRPVELDPGQQLGDDLAGARLGGPGVVGLPGEYGVTHRVRVVEGVALVEVADRQARATSRPGRCRAAPGRSAPAAASSCRRRCGRRPRSAPPPTPRARRR